jgi:putative nucleotidyltransferase with HDIG domain
MAQVDRYHVSAGTSIISESKPMILSASLGTCVGVAMFDVKARVGGLIHFLLPEPVSTEGALFPDKYATTGLPAFILALKAAGATTGNLQAVIAGGALVGPLMQQDLSLDIGGRTAENVKKILKQEGVPIVKSETGGFFTCRLNLNLMSFETEIDPIGAEWHAPDETPRVPSLADISRTIDRIYPIPQVALKILRLVDDGHYNLGAIANEVRKDQVISAKTLQMCNSAMFSRGTFIETLDHALLLLGQDLLVQLVISAAVKSFFDLKGHGYSLCKGGLFYHAIGTAQVAAILASKTGKTTVSLAYTAGLLHDIGKVVLDQYISTVAPLFYRNLIQKNQSVLKSEQEIFGTDHTEIGRRLAEKWSFPDSLIHVIGNHHEPEKEDTHSALAHVLYLADLLVSRFHPGLEMERMNGSKIVSRLEKLDLTLAQLPGIVDAIPPSVFQNSSETFPGGR